MESLIGRKLDGITPRLFGARGAGIHTAAVQAAIDDRFAQGGGVVYMPDSYTVDTLNLRRNVALIGGGIALQPRAGVNPYTYPSQLRLRAGATINADHSSLIDGLCIVRDGLAPMPPVTAGDCMALLATFSGTAITAVPGAYIHVRNNGIFGFNQAVDCNATFSQGGMSCWNNLIDCHAGLLMTGGGFNSTWSDNIFWPALSAAYIAPGVAQPTISIASPGVVTWPSAHGLTGGESVIFYTTGALPTGLLANVVYYVSATGITSTTFRVAATLGGAAINTSGTQSGTHTVVTRAEALHRQGVGFRLVGAGGAGNDWTTLTNNMTYGAQIGYELQNSSGIVMIGCQADYGVGHKNSELGFKIHGSTNGRITMVAPKSITPPVSLEIDLSSGGADAHVNIVGFDFVPNDTGIRLVRGSISGSAGRISNGPRGVWIGPSAGTLDLNSVFMNALFEGVVVDASWAGARASLAQISLGAVVEEFVIPTAVQDRVSISGVGAAAAPPWGTRALTQASGIAAGTGTITSATATMRYERQDRRVTFSVICTVTNNGTGGAFITLALPFAAEATGYHAVWGHNANTAHALHGRIDPGASVLSLMRYDGTYPVVTGNVFVASGHYECA